MRTLIFGVDGLSYRVLHPMMRAGHLPNFQALARDGVEAILESKYPPFTPPGWASISTGQKPAQHGIYDFWEYDGHGGDRLVTHRKAGKAIWNLLSDYGQRVLVVNVPLTYPPDPVNGILVSGIQGASERGAFTYPAAFREELFTQVPGYRIDVDVISVVQGKLSHAEAAVQLIEKRLALMRYLLTTKEWDFAFIAFCASDYLQHRMWEEILALQPDVLRYYQLLDEALGVARQALGPDGLLLVVSDHGFQGAHTRFAINEYLYRRGWLQSSHQRHHPAQQWLQAVGRQTLDHVGLLEHGRAIKKRFFRSPDKIVMKAPYLTEAERREAGVSVASWSCSPSAYADIGITRELSAQALADLAGELTALRDPHTNQPLVAACYPTEVYGSGPFQPKEPHLLLLPSEGYTFTPVLGRPWLWERERRLFGTHQKDGVLYACGPGVPAGQKGLHATSAANGANAANGASPAASGPPAEIYDIVPTVLAAMGQPLPAGLDGRVLSELFAAPVPATIASDGAIVSDGATLERERADGHTTVDRRLQSLLGS